jgi:hypothetical protein
MGAFFIPVNAGTAEISAMFFSLTFLNGDG